MHIYFPGASEWVQQVWQLPDQYFQTTIATAFNDKTRHLKDDIFVCIIRNHFPLARVLRK